MADPKTQYQVLRTNFYANELPAHPEWNGGYAAAKNRAKKYHKEWAKQSVDINKVVEKFTGNAQGESVGMKTIYKGERYYVLADYVGCYLRIMDKTTGKFVKIDGSPCIIPEDFNEAHYRIKTREEM